MRLSVTRRAGRIDEALKKNEIEPAVELAADFVEMADLLEPETGMEAQRALVLDKKNSIIFALNKRFKMENIKGLESGSSPKIAKTAQNIIKKQLHGYCSYLLHALSGELKKRKAWKSQCKLIKAIGITNCMDALPILRELINNEYEATILYRELAFSIFILENYSEINFDFLFDSIKKRNDLQISGACAGILYKEIIPSKNDIKKIIAGISPYTEGEGKKSTPRYYIAEIAYLWPKEETREFLESCKKSDSIVLREIASDSLEGKKSKIILI